MENYLITVQAHHRLNYFTFVIMGETKDDAIKRFKEAHATSGFTIISCKVYQGEKYE